MRRDALFGTSVSYPFLAYPEVILLSNSENPD
jgi:hypothetical protein